MNIQDAIKSGRPFKLPGGFWITAAQGKFVEHASGRTVSIYRPEEICSDEWQTKEPDILTTESQVLKICDSIFLNNKDKQLSRAEFLKIFCEELGLRRDQTK